MKTTRRLLDQMMKDIRTSIRGYRTEGENTTQTHFSKLQCWDNSMRLENDKGDHCLRGVVLPNVWS